MLPGVVSMEGDGTQGLAAGFPPLCPPAMSAPALSTWMTSHAVLLCRDNRIGNTTAVLAAISKKLLAAVADAAAFRPCWGNTQATRKARAEAVAGWRCQMGGWPQATHAAVQAQLF